MMRSLTINRRPRLPLAMLDYTSSSQTASRPCGWPGKLSKRFGASPLAVSLLIHLAPQMKMGT